MLICYRKQSNHQNVVITPRTQQKKKCTQNNICNSILSWNSKIMRPLNRFTKSYTNGIWIIEEKIQFFADEGKKSTLIRLHRWENSTKNAEKWKFLISFYFLFFVNEKFSSAKVAKLFVSGNINWLRLEMWLSARILMSHDVEFDLICYIIASRASIIIFVFASKTLGIHLIFGSLSSPCST